MDKYLKTHNFIAQKWKDAIKENKEGEYALPYPFVPPCVDGLFKCLFYWDTYYTNKGLLLDGLIDNARWNVENLLYLLDKYGFVPNSNSYPGVKHNSQPPYLHYMVEDIYSYTKDKEWLKKAYFILKKEDDFWQKERMTSIGLNRYYHHPKTEEEFIEFYDYVATRLELDKNATREDKIRIGSCLNCDCEAGLDFSPRYALEGDDICSVDLNANLYAFENQMAKWAVMFEPDMAVVYFSRANKRKNLMEKYMRDKDGIFYDFNFVKNCIETKEFNYTGQFFPFIAGVSEDKKACLKLLSKVEFAYGIASTSDAKFPYSYQAAYPYSWPYDNGLAFWALITLDLKEDYQRVGTKYLNLCANSYEASGHLWETYSAIKDEIAEKKEYPNKEMLGWTAGIFEWIYSILNK